MRVRVIRVRMRIMRVIRVGMMRVRVRVMRVRVRVMRVRVRMTRVRVIRENVKVKPGSHLFCLRRVATRSPCRHMLQRKNKKKFYSCIVLHCNICPNHLICTSGCNVTQAKKM